MSKPCFVCESTDHETLNCPRSMFAKNESKRAELRRPAAPPPKQLPAGSHPAARLAQRLLPDLQLALAHYRAQQELALDALSRVERELKLMSLVESGEEALDFGGRLDQELGDARRAVVDEQQGALSILRMLVGAS